MSEYIRKQWILEAAKSLISPTKRERNPLPINPNAQIRRIDESAKRLLLSDIEACIWANVSDECFSILRQARAGNLKDVVVGAFVSLTEYKVTLSTPPPDPVKVGAWEEITNHAFQGVTSLQLELNVTKLQFLGGDEVEVRGEPIHCSSDPEILHVLHETPLGELTQRMATRQEILGNKGNDRNSKASPSSNKKWRPAWDLDTVCALAEKGRLNRSIMAYHPSELGSEVQDESSFSKSTPSGKKKPGSSPVTPHSVRFVRSKEKDTEEEEEEEAFYPQGDVVIGSSTPQVSLNQSRPVKSPRHPFAIPPNIEEEEIVPVSNAPSTNNLTSTLAAAPSATSITTPKSVGKPSELFQSEKWKNRSKSFLSSSSSKRASSSPMSAAATSKALRTSPGAALINNAELSQHNSKSPSKLLVVPSPITPVSISAPLTKAVTPARSAADNNNDSSVIKKADSSSPSISGGKVRGMNSHLIERMNAPSPNVTTTDNSAGSMSTRISDAAEIKENKINSIKATPAKAAELVEKQSPTVKKTPGKGKGDKLSDAPAKGKNASPLTAAVVASLSPQAKEKHTRSPQTSPGIIGVSGETYKNVNLSPALSKASTKEVMPNLSLSPTKLQTEPSSSTIRKNETHVMSRTEASTASAKNETDYDRLVLTETESEPDEEDEEEKPPPSALRQKLVVVGKAEATARKKVTLGPITQYEFGSHDEEEVEATSGISQQTNATASTVVPTSAFTEKTSPVPVSKPRSRTKQNKSWLLGPITQAELDDDIEEEESRVTQKKTMIKKPRLGPLTQAQESSEEEEEEESDKKSYGTNGSSSQELVSSLKIAPLKNVGSSSAGNTKGGKNSHEVKFMFPSLPQMSIDATLRVHWVGDNGPAAVAGIKPGDLVVSAGPNNATTFGDIRTLLESGPLPLSIVFRKPNNVSSSSPPVKLRAQTSTKKASPSIEEDIFLGSKLLHWWGGVRWEGVVKSKLEPDKYLVAYNDGTTQEYSTEMCRKLVNGELEKPHKHITNSEGEEVCVLSTSSKQSSAKKKTSATFNLRIPDIPVPDFPSGTAKNTSIESRVSPLAKVSEKSFGKIPSPTLQAVAASAAPSQPAQKHGVKRGLIPRRQVKVFDQDDEKAATFLLKDFR